MREGVFATHALPAHGVVSIGRSSECTVCVDDTAISRRHALLHIGPVIELEDLGSANGTLVCQAGKLSLPTDLSRTAEVQDQRVLPRTRIVVKPETLIKMGASTLVVQDGAAKARPRRIWPHGFFEASLEEECARASRGKTRFALVRLHVEGNIPSSAIEEALALATRQGDVVALYGPGDYEILLPDGDLLTVEEIRERLASTLSGRSVQLRVGVALFPDDGRSPEGLVAKACGRVDECTMPEMAAYHDEPERILRDPVMQRLYALAERIADSTISVLVLGETGVGKEVLAETIHKLSPRRSKPFLRLNCAALSDSLLESELFGHERGAFTGAVQAKPGLLESADGGTVFLDEIGEVPHSTQVKLLRVLETRELQRVGAVRSKKIDVRFVAATNRDLEEEVARGGFRQDLFFRLSGIPLVIPPLRERLSEIEPLARSLITHSCRKARRRFEPELSQEALDVMLRYAWPGNIRELRNVMERAVVLCGEGPIVPEHLPLEKMGPTVSPRVARNSLLPLPPSQPARGIALGSRTDRPPAPSLRLADDATMDGGGHGVVATGGGPLRSGVEHAERELIVRALEQCAGNQTQAAKVLGISRRTLVSRLEQYQIPRPRKVQE
jgi:DNA-binding NtrC family response regulator